MEKLLDARRANWNISGVNKRLRHYVLSIVSSLHEICIWEGAMCKCACMDRELELNVYCYWYWIDNNKQNFEDCCIYGNSSWFHSNSLQMGITLNDVIAIAKWYHQNSSTIHTFSVRSFTVRQHTKNRECVDLHCGPHHLHHNIRSTISFFHRPNPLKFKRTLVMCVQVHILCHLDACTTVRLYECLNKINEWMNERMNDTV